MSASPAGSRILAEAMLVNVCIAVAAVLAYVPMRMVTLLATAWAAGAVATALGLLLLARRTAAAHEAEDWPFTFARANYVWALVLPPVLAGMAATVAFIHALRVWSVGEIDFTTTQITLILVVLGLATLLEAWMASELWSARWAFGEHTPELPIGFALATVTTLGLGVAFLVVVTVVLTDFAGLDGIGSLSMGLALVSVAAVLLWMAGQVLVDRPLGPETLERLRAAIEEAPGVHEVTAMKALEVGQDQLMVAARFAVPASATAAEVAAVTRGALDSVKAAEPRLTHVFLEPDLFRVEETSRDGLTGTALDDDWLNRLMAEHGLDSDRP